MCNYCATIVQLLYLTYADLIFIFQLEYDLVTSLNAENITVLQPSHIQEEDNPEDIPNLFVRLMSLICPYVMVQSLCTFLQFDQMSYHNANDANHCLVYFMTIQAKYARIIFLNMYENKATEILCHVSSSEACVELSLQHLLK